MKKKSVEYKPYTPPTARITSIAKNVPAPTAKNNSIIDFRLRIGD
jgi:hypothetical protein